MQKTVILFFCLIPFITRAQTDILILQRRGMHVGSYTVGDELDVQTVYKQQRIVGTITEMRHDSVYINGMPFHYHEFASINRHNSNFFNSALPPAMILAGAGLMVIGAVNGMLRKDAIKDWYTSSGLIIGIGLPVAGIIIKATRPKKYRLGGRFKLVYLTLNPNKK